ncbi:class I SAM-dependent methyltransferase [Spirosoma gilvum]
MRELVLRFIKAILPKKVVVLLQDRRYSKFDGMPTEELFTHIYREKLWGKGESDFYSGVGSDEQIIYRYVKTVADFIVENEIESIADIGCGDFRVGGSIIGYLPKDYKLRYTGVDIVDDLISYNQAHYGNQNTSFVKLNIVEDNLPKADLCTIRQVLQHLSNEQIKNIIAKFKNYKYILVTEEQPSEREGIIANLDKHQGPHIRTVYNSGVYLDKPPFNLATDIILECESDSKDRFNKPIKTVFRTYLIKNH